MEKRKNYVKTVSFHLLGKNATHKKLTLKREPFATYPGKTQTPCLLDGNLPSQQAAPPYAATGPLTKELAKLGDVVGGGAKRRWVWKRVRLFAPRRWRAH